MTKTDNKNTLTEEEIKSSIKLVLAGDKRSFERIVVQFQNQIFSTILAQVANEAIAKELAQETFIRAYKYISSFKGESTFSTWLTRIAINRVKTYFASSSYKDRIKTDPFSISEHEKILHEQNKSEEKIFPEELAEKLRFEISELKEKYKEILVLKVFQDLSYKEISKTLNIPVGTVSSRMNSALLSLRSKLKEVC